MQPGSGHTGYVALMSPRDDDRSNRQISRAKRRKDGDRSARLAREIMKLSPSALKKLELDEDQRDAVDRAVVVTTLAARRRAERTLAGDLRRFDLVDLEAKLAALGDSVNADAKHFHNAENWRTRMIAEGVAAIAEFPGGGDDELPRLIDAAQREHTTGRPPGAARKLFRHIVALLKAPTEAP